jgi:RNA polymerase sigma-70 factor (ECF subfamily)
MTPAEHGISGSGGGFPSTHWSAIESAGRESSQSPRPALGELLRRYWPALRAHLMARPAVNRDRIDDLLQGFITSKVLDADLIRRADRSRGKFRTFLATALDRYVVSQSRHERAQKRGADVTQTLDDGSDALVVSSNDPDADPFTVAWARQVLREAIARTRAQCESDGRADVWDVFESRVLNPLLHGASAPDYDQIVRRHGYSAPTQMWNAVRTGKAVFARQLRAVIAEYADSPEQIESELDDLHRICANLPQDEAPAAYPSA